MGTTPHIEGTRPTLGRIPSLICATALSVAAGPGAAVGDAAAKSAPRAVPEAAGRIEGVVFSSEADRVSLRLDAVPLEAFCRYLGTVHGINALASKGLSGNLNGSADGKDLGRVGEILLRRNGFDPVWIGGILVVRAASASGTEGTPFAPPQASFPYPVESPMPDPSENPPFVPAESIPVQEPEPAADPSREGAQGTVAMESDASSDSGDPVRTRAMPEGSQPTPSGIPPQAHPGNLPPPESPSEGPSPTENVPGAAVGVPVE